MKIAARTVLVTLGLVFVLVCSGKSLGQSQPGDNSAESTSQSKATDQSTPNTNASSSKSQSVQPGLGVKSSADSTKKARLDRSHTMAQTEQPKGSVPENSFRNIARQVLLSLDASIQIARKAGISPPAGWESSGQGSNAFSTRRDDLQSQLDAAADEQAAAGVASECATALNEILNKLAASPATAAAEAAVKSNDDPTIAYSNKSSLAARLSIYLAATSLVVSLLALSMGWFLVRRAINKALTDAGLL